MLGNRGKDETLASARNIKRQAGRLSTGQINRRRFVMSALATGVTMPTAMSLASKAESATPRAGGHLRIATPDRYDFQSLLTFAVASTLTEVDEKGRVTGDLARSIGYESGGAIWRFDLREGVAFTDGSLMTPADVVGSLRPLVQWGQHGVQDVRATAEDQVTVTLSEPDLTFPRVLADPDYAITRQDADGTIWSTGGYFAERTEPHAVHLLRREDHWKPGRAHFEAVTLTYEPSPIALQTDVMAGRLDYSGGLAPETVGFLAHLPDVTVSTYPATRALVVRDVSGGRNEKAKRVILGMRSGLDREAFVKRALLGYGVVGDDLPRPPIGVGMAVSDHGRSSTTQVPVAVTCDGDEAWLPHLAEQARKLGIEIEKLSDPAQKRLLSAETLSTKQVSEWTTGYSAPPLSTQHQVQVDASIRAKLNGLKSIIDPVERDHAIETAYRSFARENGIFIPAWSSDIAAHSAKLVHAGETTPNLPHDGYRLIERWWYA